MDNILEKIKETLKDDPAVSYPQIMKYLVTEEHELVTFYKEVSFLSSPYTYYVATIPNIFNSEFDYKFRILTKGEIITKENLLQALGLKAKRVEELIKHQSKRNAEPEPGSAERANPFTVISHSIEQFAIYLIISEIRKHDKIKLPNHLTQSFFLLPDGLIETGNIEGYLLPRYLGGNTYNSDIRIAIMMTDSIGEFRTEYHSKVLFKYKRVKTASNNLLSWGNLSNDTPNTEDIGNFTVNKVIFELLKETTGYDLLKYLINREQQQYNVVTGNEIIENYLEYYFQTMETRAVINYLRRNYDLTTREELIKVKRAKQELEDFRVFQLSRINDQEQENTYEISVKSKYTIKPNRSFGALVKDMIEGVKSLDHFDESIRESLDNSGENSPTQYQKLLAVYQSRVKRGQPSRELKAITLYAKLFETPLEEVLEIYSKLEQRRENTRLKIMLDNLDLCKTDYQFLKKQLIDYFDAIGFQYQLEFKTNRILTEDYEGKEEVHFLMKEI